MNILIRQLIIIFGCVTYSFAQVPFDCNGRSFRVLKHGAGTYLQEIQAHPTEPIFTFTDLHFFPQKEINAIAYHPSQHVIYGILQEKPFKLCRIDAHFNLEVLQTLPLPEDRSFVSGDISPDEQHLVLFGFGNEEEQNLLVLIEVQNNTYETSLLPMRTTNADYTNSYCADIAFHPTNGQLYGFDHRSQRLVTLDIENQLIDNETYLSPRLMSGNMPSIFFNAQGELFGIGAASQTEAQNRNFYQFDLTSGEAHLIQKLGIENNQDACSCPFQLKLLNRVKPRTAYTCTDLIFELTVINKTGERQETLRLTDTFPEGFIIKDIQATPNHFLYSFEQHNNLEKLGLGTNIFTFSNFEVEHNTTPTFTLTLTVPNQVPQTTFENRAYLEKNSSLGDASIFLSDDPETAIPNDPTAFFVQSIHEAPPINTSSIMFCKGEEVTLDANVFGANTYQWNTGENTATITVRESGLYEINAITECGTITHKYEVLLDDIEVEIGQDQTVQEGESVALQPNISSYSTVRTFYWQASTAQLLDCQTCENPIARPRTNAAIELTVENETGCQAKDALLLKVAEFKIFTPNVFSPNGDNQNDYFYLQGNVAYGIARFQVFDRWGNLVFYNQNISSNQPKAGWNGQFKGENAAENVYVWQAEIQNKDGSRQVLRGDVQLVR